MEILYYTKNEDDANDIHITIMSSLIYNTFQTWLVISFCRITSMFVLIVDFMVKLFNIVDGSCCFDAIWAVLAVLAGFYFFVYFHLHLQGGGKIQTGRYKTTKSLIIYLNALNGVSLM